MWGSRHAEVQRRLIAILKLSVAGQILLPSYPLHDTDLRITLTREVKDQLTVIVLLFLSVEKNTRYVA